MTWHLTKIPKVIHLYWGAESLSFLRYMTVYSLRKYNSDWDIFIHVPKFLYLNKTWRTHEHKNYAPNQFNYFDKLKELDVKILEHDFSEYGFRNEVSEVHKADFIRWKILAEAGGFWSDFDIVYIRSMNELHFNIDEFKEVDIGLCAYGVRLTAIGFLFGCKDCNFWNCILNLSRKNYDPNLYQCIGVDLLNSQYYNAELIKKNFPKHKPIMIDKNTVYALDYNRIKSIFQEIVDVSSDKRAIGIHWYAGHRMSQTYEASITEKNYGQTESTICNFIAKVME